MQDYVKGHVIGEGTYGSVVCATHKPTGRTVALKKVRLGASAAARDGVAMSVVRELKALRALASPHVVELLDVFSTKGSLVLAFEHMEASLEDVLRDRALPLGAADVKALARMMLQALAHVHGAGFAHRDVKPDNLLVGADGRMKLADFGLARMLDGAGEPAGKLTPQVFGRWYRPPELLMGCSQYGAAVDMWAAGCVLAELLLRRPWFPGVCDVDQLDRIFEVLGVPTVEAWPGLADLPHRVDFKAAPGQPLQQVFPQASPECLDLLRRMVEFDPGRRITAAEALSHPYFAEEPAPTPAALLPRPAPSRCGRRGAAAVPALMHDLLTQPAMMLRQQRMQQQQQQQALGGGGAGCGAFEGPLHGAGGGLGGLGNRHALAFSGHTSFSGRFLGGGGGGPLHGADGLAAAHAGPSGLCRGASGGLDGDQQGPLQHQHQHPCPRAQGAAALLEDVPAVPWKGRLSFSSFADEPAGSSGGDHQGDQQAASSGGQQQLLLRPSPVLGQQAGGRAGGGGSGGSMRPPLHRGSSFGSGATPLPARPDGADDAAAGAAAGGGRRRVSDLSAALANAAGASGGLLAGGLLAAAPQAAAGQQFMEPQGGLDVTPAASLAAVRSRRAAAGGGGTEAGAGAAAAAEQTPLDANADAACPMSLGPSTHKRSRDVFEALPGAQQQQQQQDAADALQCGAAPMSVGGGGRRMLRGRRSSMGSGCCSMDTDGAPPGSTGADATAALPLAAALAAEHQTQQQQPHAAGARSAFGAGAVHAPDVQQQQQQQQLLLEVARQQQQRETQQLGRQPDPHQRHRQQQQQQQQQGGSRAQLQPWDPSAGPVAAAPGGAAGAKAGAEEPGQPAARAAGDEGRDVAGCCSGGGPAQPCSSGGPGSGAASCCPMSLDQGAARAASAARRAAAAAASASARGSAGGSAGTKAGSGCRAGGGGLLAAGGCPEALAAMDPADLAELASWWRPRLDAAERQYLRDRKQQMDAALLQASQQGDDFGSPLLVHRGGLFGSPGGSEVRGATQQQQQQQQQDGRPQPDQQQQHHQPLASAAAGTAAAGGEEQQGRLAAAMAPELSA